MKPVLVITAALVLAAPAGFAQAPKKPPEVFPPDEGQAKLIGQRIQQLGRTLVALQRQGVRDPVLAEVEVYHKAAEWMVRHKEYYLKDSAAQTLAVLDRGMLRASQAARGESPWLQISGSAVVRAYRSRVDGSVQPFAVTLPESYGRDPRQKWRLDVVLHGRDDKISEVKFLAAHAGDKPAAERPYVQLDIFGRGNNAYRWAGEMDVLEVLDAFVGAERALGRGELLDLSRVVLRGFSMGGAGTWHLGLHRPDRWCVIGPGAGFTTTRGYWNDLPEKLPAHVEKCLHIYDAVDYAANARMVPVVAYAGEKDAQLKAAQNIEAALKPLNVPFTLLVAPGLAHQFPDEWQAKAEIEYAKFAGPGKGRREPDRVQFMTYTLKYPSADWVEILGLDEHYTMTEVDATRSEKGYAVKTTNVRVLRMNAPPGDASPQPVTIDGQELTVRPAMSSTGQPALYLEKRAGKWVGVLPQRIITDRQRRAQKVSGLQGPIDDAFTDAFLCVRGTGRAWNEATQKFADAELERFRDDWDKYFRGELPVKNDTEVTDEEIATRHLILFGDPGCNSLIAQVLDGLPLTWTKEKVTLAGVGYDATSHVPVMIYPNPLNGGRYVVLNSGHTFRRDDFIGTNARLFPRYGDYAVLKPTPAERDPAAAEVATAGLFDDFWRLASGR